MEIPFFPSASERSGRGLPQITLQNLFLAREPELLRQLGRKGPTLIDMPGSRRFGNLGADPVRGVFYYPGAGGTDMLAVHGETISRVTSAGTPTAIGTLPGSDIVGWDMVRDITLVCGGGAVSTIVGSTVTRITDPDLGTISAIAALNGRLIAAREGTDTFVWSDVLAPTSIQSLSFATAEAYGDKLIRPVVHQRRLMLLGAASLEIWQTGPTSGQAFVRLGDAVEPIGLGAKDSVATAGPALCFVAVDRSGSRSVVKFDGGLGRISDAGVDEMLQALTEAEFAAISGFMFTVAGQTFYQIDLAGFGSWCCHIQSGTWHRRRWGRDTLWRNRVATEAFGRTIVGSRIDGKLYALEPELWLDDADGAALPIERIATSYIGVRKNTRISSLDLDCGVRGASVAPVAHVAASADDGETWSQERPVALQHKGRRGRKARNWPMARNPGMLVRARFTGEHGVALGSLLVNEAGA